jgi:predicted acyl esterase
VILQQDPYSPGPSPGSERDWLVSHGYIWVDFDLRGHGVSDGNRDFLSPQMGSDGAELVDWASSIAGASGAVGLAGCSYLGVIQLVTAAAVKPESPLQAITPFCVDSDMYRDLVADGGIPTAFLPGLDSILTPGPTADPEQDEVSVTVADLLSGGPRSYFNEYWQERSGIELIGQIVDNDIPALTHVGWFDLFPGGNLGIYGAAQNAFAGRPLYAPMKPGQPVTGRYQAIVGPWVHGEAYDSQQLLDLKLEWFDTWLKDVDTGMEDTDRPLHLYLNGGGRWIDTAYYPITRNPPTYHLAGTARETTRPGRADVWTGQLAWAPATEDNTLTYTSDPIQGRPQAIAGPSTLTVYVSANTSDVMLAAKLSVVRADGTTEDIAVDGALIGRQRTLDESRTWFGNGGQLLQPYHHFTEESAQPITPGAIERLDIALLPTLTQLEPGDRLRLMIASQTPTGYHTQLVPTVEQTAVLAGGVYSIHTSRATPSSLRVPLIPVGRLHTSPVSWGPGE